MNFEPNLYTSRLFREVGMVVPKSKGTRLVATNVMEHPVLYTILMLTHHFISVVKIIMYNVAGMLHYTRGKLEHFGASVNKDCSSVLVQTCLPLFTHLILP